jgi:predicted nucleic-acid-binding Zn-ribbon protein
MQPASDTCPRCGSTARITTAELATDNTGLPIVVKVPRRPDAAVFKHMEYATLRVTICGACGHVDLYAKQPEALYEAFLEGEQHRLG